MNTNKNRILSIDIMRGLTLFLMLFVNDLFVPGVPKWLVHTAAQEDGMGLADWVFPGFLFMVGLSIPFAFIAREKRQESNRQILIHILIRTGSLLLIGVFMVNLESYSAELTGMNKFVWAILVYLSIFLIWNHYPRESKWAKWFTGMKVLGMLGLLILAALYRSGSPENIGWMQTSWWGILGLIGWGYVVSALTYLFLRDRIAAIAAPNQESLHRFVSFIKEELPPRQINTLILRVDYNFQYQSHPELAEEEGLSQEQVNQLVDACQEHNIDLIPQINLLGHQSWHSDLEMLLKVYPQFDETPSVKLPAPDTYEWPNEDGLYCKSYCPLHPEVHAVIFDLVDEIVAAFQADAFHAGMDEVFYIGQDECPRCSGKDKAELFAGELTTIRNHLAQTDKTLWIWGDRLLDGKTTGLGMWEASMNNTHRAIDMIPKDIMICDWHYERAEPTAAYFALKGFDVFLSG